MKLVRLCFGYGASNDLVVALATAVDRHPLAPLLFSPLLHLSAFSSAITTTSAFVSVAVASIFPARHVCDGGVDAFAHSHAPLQAREKDEAAQFDTTPLILSFATQTQLAAWQHHCLLVPDSVSDLVWLAEFA